MPAPAAAVPATADLRAWLGPPARLHDPRRLHALDALPLTPNGKLDRRALPAPGRDPAAAGDAPPRTPAEQALAAIWAEVLGTARVGVDDNFFELGGDSILSIQVVSRARQAGLAWSSRDLFRHQTVAELAAADTLRAAAPAELIRGRCAGRCR